MYNATIMGESIDRNNRWLEVLTGLNRAMRFCRQDEAFCEGVTFHQFMILEAIAETGSRPMRDLHERLGVAKSTTTRFVGPLIERKLVKRLKDRDDSRAVRLSLTPEGREIHASVGLCLSGFLDRVVAHIPPSRREATLEAMDGFIEAIGKTAGETNCCTIPGGKIGGQGGREQ